MLTALEVEPGMRVLEIGAGTGYNATLRTSAEPPYEVRQGGPRKPWDEVHSAYQWWVHAG